MRRLGGLEPGGEVGELVGAVCTIVSLDSPEESLSAESEEMATVLRRFLRDLLREGRVALGVLRSRSWRWPFVAFL